MPVIEADTADRLAGPNVRPIAFLLIKTNAGEWVRAWTGFGARRVAIDTVDTAGGLYTGAGMLVGFPVLSQLVNGVFERVDFTLSGVNARARSLAASEASNVRNAPAFVGFSALDQHWAQIMPPLWLWEGDADVIRKRRAQGVYSIGISVGTVGSGRRRPELDYLTGPAQHQRSPGDAGCDRVGLYSVGGSDTWPA